MGGGGESGGYKGRKDAIKEESRRQTGAQKNPSAQSSRPCRGNG